MGHGGWKHFVVGWETKKCHRPFAFPRVAPVQKAVPATGEWVWDLRHPMGQGLKARALSLTCINHRMLHLLLFLTARLCLSLCWPGDGGENPPFWYIPVSGWASSGPSWSAWDHTNWTGTRTGKHARTGEVRCSSTFTRRNRVVAEDIHRCYRLRNLARSRPVLTNQTSGGASVTRVCTPSRWWEPPPWCYSGAYLYPCCSHDHLNHMTTKTNRSG